ncbi:FAD/NAD(P)-binding protein [Halovenus salina]|uniref:FAD/NAD(P)-binding protein n=1 Tax=Halovenus salina TaxID=1510225 RepID=A0ABD5W8N8_9EURY|nr:FAD/NAD(P)-binding protein [Halovenus salina]
MTGEEPTTQQPKDCVVVGGGIHGTYVARELLDAGIEQDLLAVVDPHDELLASFRKKAHACGMAALRSSFVQHLGSEPFSLEKFATENSREHELVMTVDYPARPSLSLFLDHAESIIDSRGIDALHSQATVEAITRDGDRYCIETTTGQILSENVVLAIGRGGRYQYPEWADVEGLTSSSA